MSGIAERASRLRDLVDLADKVEKLLNEAQALDGRVRQLKGWEGTVRSLLPAAKALKAASAPSAVALDLGVLRRSAERALRDFREDSASARRPTFDAANIFWNQAPGRLAAAEATLRVEWRSHVNGRMVSYQPAVVRALAGDEATSVESSLVQLSRQADTLASRLPTGDEEVRQVEAVALEIRLLLQRFDLAALPTGVQAFIRAALEDGATIGLLTVEVKDWLVKRGIDHNVRVTFVTPG